MKNANSRGVCTISAGSNGRRKDWLVRPHRALDDDLLHFRGDRHDVACGSATRGLHRRGRTWRCSAWRCCSAFTRARSARRWP